MTDRARTERLVDKNYQKFRDLLAELFQLEQAELDFGIYRIMAARRDDILRFLDHDLRPQVEEAFAAYKAADKKELEKDLAVAIEQARGLGIDPDSAPRVRELRARLAEAVDLDALEAEVYNHLVTFFSRYYREGDFISQRRYKNGVYAIPYNGEEVKLYWANHDQYYIKTAEYLTHYAFRLPSGRRVRFELVAAAPTVDNNKPAPGEERRFILHEPDPVVLDGNELVVRFEYRPDPAKRKQAELNEAARERLLGLGGPSELLPWLAELGAKAPTEKNPDRTLLEKHLANWTARNTFDYFIHKDLGGFLRRELDFYIKHEVLHLEDLEEAPPERIRLQATKVKVLRAIAEKIIDFLAQLENFQKKLWLKKKFVIETSWCVSIGTILKIEDQAVREALLAEIAANDAQREEWVRLCAIDRLPTPLGNGANGQRGLFEDQIPGYSVPLTPAFLKNHPTLMVDTKHFDPGFTLRLLAAIGDLEEQTDGLLVHSENFQALSLMQAKYREQIKCIHIDPPYNTETSGFLYKNTYRHSSWLSMMIERIRLGISMLIRNGSFLSHIDENEYERLQLILDDIGLPSSGTVIWDSAYGFSSAALLSAKPVF
ncbi:MAG: DNA methyltransferase, partial [Bacillota bacterium]